jgi:predicted metalloendopeptidase
MINRVLSAGLCAVLLSGCAKQAPEAAVTPATAVTVSGLEPRYFDTSVRPQDDLYRHINGKWLESTTIPADKARYGAFYELDAAEARLRAIVDELDKARHPC